MAKPSQLTKVLARLEARRAVLLSDLRALEAVMHELRNAGAELPAKPKKVKPSLDGSPTSINRREAERAKESV